MNKFAMSLIAATAFVMPVNADESYFEPEDIFGLEYVADPQVSPDGTHAVYVRRSYDIMTDGSRSNLWIAATDGSDNRPLVSDSKNHYSPRWSPDGKRLAYISTSEGKPQLFVRWMDTGATAMVTNLTRSPSSLAWSPDGKTLAFTMRTTSSRKPFSVKMPKKPKGATWSPPVKYIDQARYQRDGAGIIKTGFTHIYTVPANGGTPRKLTQGRLNHGGPLVWAADSKSIYFSDNHHEDWEYESRESDIFQVNVETGYMDQITDEPGSESGLAISPDGKTLAFIKSDNQKLAYRPDHLKTIDLESKTQTMVNNTLDREIGSLSWTGQGIMGLVEDHGVAYVARFNTDGSVDKMADGLGGQSMGRPYTTGDYHAAGGKIVVTKGTPTRPADLHVATEDASVALTDLNSDLLGHKTMGEVKEITYKSSFDGEDIQGWYVLPPNFDPSRKYPLILEIHGGPHASYGPHFSAEVQRYAAAGYVVFYDNHRGSTSYGERFALLLQGKYSSEEDYADHDSGVNAMIELGFIDPDRLYITGGSAGGIASAYAIGLTDRYKAAAVAKPVINWVSKVLTADSYLFQIPNQFPGMPWDHLEHYWKRSPISLMGNVVTPTLLITGEADRRTPISETEQYYQALKLKGVDTVMIRVPGSPHGIASKPSRMIAKVQNIIAWFDKYDKAD